MLSIGARSGTFPGLLAKRTLKLALVRPAHGAGDEPSSNVDRSVVYDGRAVQVNLKTTR